MWVALRRGLNEHNIAFSSRERIRQISATKLAIIDGTGHFGVGTGYRSGSMANAHVEEIGVAVVEHARGALALDRRTGASVEHPPHFTVAAPANLTRHTILVRVDRLPDLPIENNQVAFAVVVILVPP